MKHQLIVLLFIVFCQIPHHVRAESNEMMNYEIISKYCNVKKSEYLYFDNKNNVVCIAGPIEYQLANKFSGFEINDRTWIIINSGGGEMEAALKIGFRILDKNASVIVKNVCMSACANYIFLAGKNKVVLKDSIVAWHAIPYHSFSLDMDSKTIEYRKKMGRIHDLFISKIGINPDLVSFPPYGPGGKFDRTKEWWTVDATVLEKVYNVKGILWMSEIGGDNEIIGQVPVWHFEIP